jgi:hypothetical protein
MVQRLDFRMVQRLHFPRFVAARHRSMIPPPRCRAGRAQGRRPPSQWVVGLSWTTHDSDTSRHVTSRHRAPPNPTPHHAAEHDRLGRRTILTCQDTPCPIIAPFITPPPTAPPSTTASGDDALTAAASAARSGSENLPRSGVQR